MTSNSEPSCFMCGRLSHQVGHVLGTSGRWICEKCCNIAFMTMVEEGYLDPDPEVNLIQHTTPNGPMSKN